MAKAPGLCFCNLTELFSPNSSSWFVEECWTTQDKSSIFEYSVYIVHLTTAPFVGEGEGVRREVVIEITTQYF